MLHIAAIEAKKRILKSLILCKFVIIVAVKQRQTTFKFPSNVLFFKKVGPTIRLH